MVGFDTISKVMRVRRASVRKVERSGGVLRPLDMKPFSEYRREFWELPIIHIDFVWELGQG